MKSISIGDCIKILSGYPFKSEYFNEEGLGLPLIRVRDVNSGISGMFYSGKYPEEYVIRNGDILIGMDGDFNAVKWEHGNALLNQRVCKLVVNGNKLNESYLLQYLPIALKSIHEKTNFTTVKHLSSKSIESIKIPFPLLDDQVRIATLLTRAEKLIAKRKESIAALDELLKSTFLEMFGLDGAQYKKWKIEPLSESTEVVSGVTKGKKYNGANLISVPYMRVANVQDGHLNLAEIKMIEVTVNELGQFKLRKGDLLLTEGGDPDKLGRGAVWNDEVPDCIHQNHIFRVRARNSTVLPDFLSALMASKYGKGYFLRAAKQTTGIASINSTQLKAFPLIKPPVELQNEFAAIVAKVKSLKSQYSQSLIEIENFYNSLSQRTFKGELDLRNVPIEHAATLPQTVKT